MLGFANEPLFVTTTPPSREEVEMNKVSAARPEVQLALRAFDI